MRILCTIAVLVVALAGCVKPQEQKVRPDAPATKPVKLRPITSEMVTPESGHKVCDQVNEELDREARK